jgi:hypothetical protein
MTPIQCDDTELGEIRSIFPCKVMPFPCKYLGLSLSIRKLPRSSFNELINKIADKLPGWKAAIISPAGRATLIKSVLTAIPIYHLIALNCPKWVIRAINKIRRGFLWKGRTDVRGGHCVVGWSKVCRPINRGGLRIHNLDVLGWSLNMRWLWLKKTQPERSWSKFDFQVHPNAAALFSVSVCSFVGDGQNTLFWTDRWLHGKSVGELAPALLSRIPMKIQKIRTVHEALLNNRWVSDLTGSLSADVLMGFFCIWDVTRGIHLQPGISDQHRWLPTANGKYSSKSAYDRYFAGSVYFEPSERIWRSWAPQKCKFFIWLASLNKCWTADRLARRGLNHPDKCLLCDQQEETAQHILVACVFARHLGPNFEQGGIAAFGSRNNRCSFTRLVEEG